MASPISMGNYIHWANIIPLLTNEEEKNYAEDQKNGNVDAII